jgi:cytidylate kinase
MRIPKKLVIGIFGRTCSGKTSISEKLAKRTGINCRHCGQILKKIAKREGISPKLIDRRFHETIDAETRSLAEKPPNGKAIIEGSFLNYVLYGLKEVILIELICADNERAIRYIARSGQKDGMKNRDYEDSLIVKKLYSKKKEKPQYKIDVTHLTIPETVDKICEKLGI